LYIGLEPNVAQPKTGGALLHQGRLACPDAKRAGLFRNDRTKDGVKLKAILNYQ
jgi:hypothetical protein